MVQHSDIDHTGITGTGSGAGSTLQFVTAVSTADDTTTAATLQASSLSCAITPIAADSILKVEVWGEARAERVAGTILERYGWYAIRNTTDAVTLVEQVRGIALIGTSGTQAEVFFPIALTGLYTVNSLTARTFQLQYRAAVATNVRAYVLGSRTGGVRMAITEIAV